MLVLSRREDQRIVFPELGIRVSILRISGSVAKVGIEAPQSVKVLRDELAIEDSLVQKLEGSGEKLEPQQIHQLKNLLSPVTIGLQLLTDLIERGQCQHAESVLKRVVSALEQLDQAVANWRVRQPAAPQHRFRALLIEDDANERELLAEYLRMSGIDVVTAEDGLQGMAYLNQNHGTDLVLVDMQMPNCDGPTFVSHIRSQKELQDIPMFAVSGCNPADVGVTTGTSGIDRWFSKPLNARCLLESVTALRS